MSDTDEALDDFPQVSPSINSSEQETNLSEDIPAPSLISHSSSYNLLGVDSASNPVPSKITTTRRASVDKFRRPDFVVGATVKCPNCKKSVYKAEELQAFGSTWHKSCFCCGGGGELGCKRVLRVDNCQHFSGIAYCKTCAGTLFTKTGELLATPLNELIGAGTSIPVGAEFDSGAPVLAGSVARRASTFEATVAAAAAAAAAAQDVNPVAANPKRRASVAEKFRNASALLENLEKCPFCSKPVYLAEEMHALGATYHKLCFCCGGLGEQGCKRVLAVGHFMEQEGVAYCPACFGRLFVGAARGANMTRKRDVNQELHEHDSSVDLNDNSRDALDSATQGGQEEDECECEDSEDDMTPIHPPSAALTEHKSDVLSAFAAREERAVNVNDDSESEEEEPAVDEPEQEPVDLSTQEQATEEAEEHVVPEEEESELLAEESAQVAEAAESDELVVAAAEDLSLSDAAVEHEVEVEVEPAEEAGDEELQTQEQQEQEKEEEKEEEEQEQLALETTDILLHEHIAPRPPSPRRVQFTYTADFDHAGLFYYLGSRRRTQAYENPHAINEVLASMSSVYRGAALNVVGRSITPNHPNYTENAANSWAKIDLGPTRLFMPDHYCLRHGGASDGNALRNWKLQGKVHDTDEWVTLCTHTKDHSLRDSMNATASWSLDIPSIIKEGSEFHRGFRYLRLSQFGPNSSGNNCLFLGGLEFYGVLCELDRV